MPIRSKFKLKETEGSTKLIRVKHNFNVSIFPLNFKIN